MADNKYPGEDKAWRLLLNLQPADVCRSAAVVFDPLSCTYRVPSFGTDFLVSPRERTITAAPGSCLDPEQDELFRLSVLCYLVHAKDIACTNRPVKLHSIRGGQIFTTGSHVLPLEHLAARYAKDRDGFLRKGMGLGGRLGEAGDASLVLYPLPRIPVTLILWLEDEEFPARADLLIDSTCHIQLPTDVIWSVVVMTVRIMMEPSR